jgi:ADP-ribose pyrophosphatase
MAIEPWEVKSEEVVFEKFGRKVVKRDYKMPDGKVADFYIKQEKDFCCILALTPQQEVILVRQFRPGPGKVLLEMPGGVVEAQNPLLSITDELTSETGYNGAIEYVGECVVEGYTTSNKHCYVARDCTKVSDQNLETTEFLEVELMSLDNFRTHLRSGQLTDVEVGYLCLDYLGLL